MSTRRSWLRGKKLKFLLRGEIGYTDADVDTVAVEIDSVPLELSVTQLPNFYRFKAGGSASVRGYDFEQLSNNNIGSNNIVTASAEFEYRLTNKWSAALFADIGNAFNDWSDTSSNSASASACAGTRSRARSGSTLRRRATSRTSPRALHLTIGTPLL